jgi:hypothetical protein
MEKKQLKCQVLKGMFSNERAVVVLLQNGKKSSAFVPASEVSGEVDRDGMVNVDVFWDRGSVWAVLPTEYRETLPVNVNDLVSQ